ncbi:MAG: alpha/beta hydrolase, partial [Pseudomonadota bacterium]|nr:alpha/beta hydrolase [Pseudomonadota bacterium]
MSAVMPLAAVASHRAPWWLPGGHLQTIWPPLFSHATVGDPPQFRRERWTTPDQDFIDVDFLADPPDSTADTATRPLLILFHGLEGSSRSGYAKAFACLAREQGWSYAVPHFRGCSGELNLAPRAYHSGDYQEVEGILRRMSERRGGPVLAVGISLGGNMLLRWAEESGASAASKAQAVAAVCSPVDLAAGGHAIGKGFGLYTYTRM